VLVSLLLVGALVEGARSVGLPLVLKQFVDTAGIVPADRSALLALALTYGVLALSGIGTVAALNALAQTYAGMVADRMHAERLGVLLSSDMIDQPWDDAQHAVDSLDSSDDDVRRSLATGAGQVLPALASLVGLYTVIALMDPLLLVALLLPLLLLAVVPRAVGRVRRVNAFDHARQVRALILSHDIACARDDLRGVDSGDSMLNLLDEELTTQRARADSHRRGALLAPLVVQVVGLGTFVLAIALALVLLRSGALTAGDLFGVINAVFLIRSPLTTVAVNIRDLPHAVGLLRRRPAPVVETAAVRTLGAGEADVRFPRGDAR
jgi:ABC-type multidrug transport system fused ATPase/permease subunit